MASLPEAHDSQHEQDEERNQARMEPGNRSQMGQTYVCKSAFDFKGHLRTVTGGQCEKKSTRSPIFHDTKPRLDAHAHLMQ